MKKNDIAVLILIVSVSAMLAYFLGNALIGKPNMQPKQVEVVEAFTPSVSQPSTKVFNEQAINPTVPIQIGQPSNQQPFGGN